MEARASRLDARRVAALQGATTEFRKGEGLTWDPDRNRVYVAWSDLAYGMEDAKKRGEPNDKYDIGGPNHIRLPWNPCGGVFALDASAGATDTGGNPIASAYVAGDVRLLRAGVPKMYPEDSEHAGNRCHIDDLASPDNLTYLPGYDTLIIGEDTSHHINDVIWSMNLKTGDLTRIFSTPYGAETTSPYWYRDVGGHGYLMTVVQHPYAESDQDKVRDQAKDTRSLVGVIGPFPKL